MPINFLKSTKHGRGRAAHDHVVMINDDDPQNPVAVCSVDKDHTHDVVWVVDQEAATEQQQDPQTGEVIEVVVQEEQGHWELGPSADAKSHMHDGVLEIEPEEPKKREETEEEIISSVYAHWKEAYNAEAEELEEFEENERFYQGDQWSEEDKAYLTERNRTCLTLNLAGIEIDRLCGYQMENAQDFTFTPIEDGDDLIAEILNHISRIDMRNTGFHREESEVFLDMAIGGRGQFNMYVDHEKDIEGQIMVERYPYSNVRYLPHEKPDASDCEGILKDRMYSKQKIEQLFPEKAEEIHADYSHYETLPGKATTEYADDAYNHEDPFRRIPMTMAGEDMVSLTRKEFRVIERWLKFYQKVFVVAVPQDRFYSRLEGWSEADAKRLETIPGVHIFPQRVTKIRITKVAGNTLLEDEIPDLAVDDFHIVPVYANKRGNKFWGKLSLAKDANKNLNKFMSLLTDIMARMASYGWYYDDTTFPDPKEKKRFLKNSAKPGFVQKVNNVARTPVKEQGVQFPSEVASTVQMYMDHIVSMLNINVESAGANESGTKFLQRQKAKLAGNQRLFTNLQYAKRKIGQMYLALVQKYYTPERIYRMLEAQNRREALLIGGEEFAKYSRDEIVRLLTVADLTRYDVDVIDSPASPTARLATSLLLLELAQAGVQIPPDILISNSEIPASTKAKILEGYQSDAAMQAEAQQATADAELMKTAIAKEIITPKIAERLGIQPQEPQVPDLPPDQQGAGPQL